VDHQGEGLSSDAPKPDRLAELEGFCDTIESAYEFMLAYASRGIPKETGSEIRDTLGKLDGALADLADCVTRSVEIMHADAAGEYAPFIDVIRRDASDARAAIRLVTVQPSIGSQLVDNLNASVHLRALLTGLFLIDEVLKSRRRKV
jgi:hypothetical protein